MNDESFSRFIVRFKKHNDFLQRKYKNKSSAVFHRIYNLICFLYGCYLPIDVRIGGGFRTPHGLRGVYIACGTIIGKKVTLLHQVILGSNYIIGGKGEGPPKIEDDVFIGTGVKIIGPIKIGKGARIGANVAIAKSVPPNCTVAPALPRIIVS